MLRGTLLERSVVESNKYSMHGCRLQNDQESLAGAVQLPRRAEPMLLVVGCAAASGLGKQGAHVRWKTQNYNPGVVRNHTKTARALRPTHSQVEGDTSLHYAHAVTLRTGLLRWRRHTYRS